MKLGIDFGTFYSSAALLIGGVLRPIKEPSNSQLLCFPSSVCLTKKGEILIGLAAENARKANSNGYKNIFKRDLGQTVPYFLGEQGREFLPEDLVTEILSGLKREAEKTVNSVLDSAVITVPATYLSNKKELMRYSAIKAGFREIIFLEEPVAAAIYYSQIGKIGHQVKDGEIVLIYDLGGGTFDAALIQKQGERYQLLGLPVGDPECGGIDFEREIDRDFKQYLAGDPTLELLKSDRNDRAALLTKFTLQDWYREVKHQLSQAEEIEEFLMLPSLELSDPYILSRSKFEEMIRSYLDKTCSLCQQLVQQSRTDWAKVDRILLVGGSTRIPYVKNRLEQQFKRPVIYVDDPELAICYGAAIYGNSSISFDQIAVDRRGQTITRIRKEAQYRVEDLGGGVSLEMVSIPAGTFRMGTPEAEAEQMCDRYRLDCFRSETPQHQVFLSAFEMGKYPITQAQWRAIALREDLKVRIYLNPVPSCFKGDNRPVEQVTWSEAIEFCRRLAKLTGKDYHLPSEAQWEYACRAGTNTPFNVGETLTSDLANYDASYVYAQQFQGNYRQQTTEVGQFAPNGFGLHDLHGNVWEWCEDDWQQNYVGAPHDGKAWVNPDGSSALKVMRGGSWGNRSPLCRSAYRQSHDLKSPQKYIGLRVVVANDNLQATEVNMDNSNQNLEANEILKNLQRLFSDRPEVLRLLDPSNLDPDRVAGEVILDNYRNQEGFASPVNFYATGKTRAGKTSLGNTIFDGKQTAMKSTGYRDCTFDLGSFQSANNLRYFDLPGAGSNENFENINRAILCMIQIKSRRGKNPEVTEFVLSDYTDFTKTQIPKQKTISVDKWQSNENQLIYGADVILYVIAPHEGLGRDDETYMYDLLSAQKEKRGSSNVVFALNLHLTENGEPKYTKPNVEDAYKTITDIYNEVFSNHPTKPAIIEINSLTGLGADKIAEEICKLLPTDKLGKMEEVLGDKLKEKARKVRSKKFREALIYIASRLATFKVDQSFDNSSDIVLGSYAAVYSYSSKVFKKEVPSGENAYGVVSNFADQTKESRTENITIKEPIIESIERFRIISEPVFGYVEEIHETTIESEEIVETKRDALWGAAQVFMGSKVDKVKQPKVIQTKTKKHSQTGTNTTEVSNGYETAVTGYNDKIVGLKHLKGGYDIIKGILSIGVGIESLPNENIGNFNRIYEAGEKEINLKIGNLKSRIEQVINNSDPKRAENEIIEILKKALL